MDYIITAFTMIFTIYGIYRYYRNVILLKNIKKMIMNLDQNIAIDIIKFCDCKYNSLLGLKKHNKNKHPNIDEKKSQNQNCKYY